MKTIGSSIVLLLICLFACQGYDRNNTNDNYVKTTEAKDTIPVIEFKDLIYDLGKIKQGEKVGCSFTYKNSGKSDLIISSVRTSCGCTVSKWNNKPVQPGGKDKIDVVFNSAGRLGKQSKSITVISNSQPEVVVLKIMANVVENKK